MPIHVFPFFKYEIYFLQVMNNNVPFKLALSKKFIIIKFSYKYNIGW